MVKFSKHFPAFAGIFLLLISEFRLWRYFLIFVIIICTTNYKRKKRSFCNLSSGGKSTGSEFVRGRELSF